MSDSVVFSGPLPNLTSDDMYSRMSSFHQVVNEVVSGKRHTMVNGGDFSKLTQKLGVKVCAGSPCSVEEVALAVGELIGHGSVKSAARMNNAVVLFVEKVEQVNQLVQTGVTVGGMFEPVLPLTQPATKVTLSNVPPFISDAFLSRELSRHWEGGLSH
ncbi:hypothetical protein L3Q82_009672 [Scortum barcoo]|uniref:Uncharacterized protein n=1 Tax=Scortum barcoo TaxID=214431 RepID=A0ACB8WID5_9TELE|nr:hypothetical protein L3Q82_009672 [Scortum barcoo]